MCILNTNVCMIRMSVIFFSRHAFCNTFSTHDLSWRSTSGCDYVVEVHFFQLMTSRGGRQTGTCRSCDRYNFQLTTSRGGRCFWYISNGYGICFSTHDLSWRSTYQHGAMEICEKFSTHDLSWRSTYLEDHTYSPKIFQLTTSRGGRQLPDVDYKIVFNFSTHDLSWRSTILHILRLK